MTRRIYRVRKIYDSGLLFLDEPHGRKVVITFNPIKNSKYSFEELNAKFAKASERSREAAKAGNALALKHSFEDLIDVAENQQLILKLPQIYKTRLRALNNHLAGTPLTEVERIALERYLPLGPPPQEYWPKEK